MCKPMGGKNLYETEEVLVVLKPSYLKQFPHLNAA